MNFCVKRSSRKRLTHKWWGCLYENLSKNIRVSELADCKTRGQSAAFYMCSQCLGAQDCTTENKDVFAAAKGAVHGYLVYEDSSMFRHEQSSCGSLK
jgi:hypothetical protein